MRNLLLAAAAGLVAGLLLGWSLHSAHPAANSDEAENPGGTVTAAANSATSAKSDEVKPRLPEEQTSVFATRLHEARNAPARKRARMVSSIADDLSIDEVRAALAQRANWPVAERGEILAALLARWAEIDPPAALAYAMKLKSPEERSRAITAAIGAWAERDAAAAATAALAQPPSAQRHSILSEVFGAWSLQDEDAAVKFLEALPDGMEKTRTLRTAIQSSLENAALALRLISLMPAGNMQDGALHALAQNWMNLDPAAALAWAREQTDPQVKKSVWPGIVTSLAQYDTAAALTLAQELEGGARQDAMDTVIRGWSANDPAAAAEWVSAQPENADFLGTVASNWVRIDPTALGAWIRRLPAGEARDHALQGAGVQLGIDNPEAAPRWIERIADEDKRQLSYRVFAVNWLNADSAAALRWIATAPLTAETRERVLRYAPKAE